MYSTILQGGLSILWQHEKLSLCHGHLTFTLQLYILLLPYFYLVLLKQWLNNTPELLQGTILQVTKVNLRQAMYEVSTVLFKIRVVISHQRFRVREFT